LHPASHPLNHPTNPTNPTTHPTQPTHTNPTNPPPQIRQWHRWEAKAPGGSSPQTIAAADDNDGADKTNTARHNNQKSDSNGAGAGSAAALQLVAADRAAAVWRRVGSSRLTHGIRTAVAVVTSDIVLSPVTEAVYYSLRLMFIDRLGLDQSFDFASFIER